MASDHEARRREFDRLQAIVDSKPYQDLLKERYAIEEVLNELHGLEYAKMQEWAIVMNALKAMHES